MVDEGVGSSEYTVVSVLPGRLPALTWTHCIYLFSVV